MADEADKQQRFFEICVTCTATQNEELRARLSAMAVSVGDLEAEAASLKATVASIAAEDGR